MALRATFSVTVSDKNLLLNNMRNIPRYIPHIIFTGYWRLLPLNGCWWLGGAVVDYTIDALNIINDLIGDLGE